MNMGLQGLHANMNGITRGIARITKITCLLQQKLLERTPGNVLIVVVVWPIRPPTPAG